MLNMLWPFDRIMKSIHFISNGPFFLPLSHGLGLEQ
jgi:hypothetical protein